MDDIPDCADASTSGRWQLASHAPSAGCPGPASVDVAAPALGNSSATSPQAASVTSSGKSRIPSKYQVAALLPHEILRSSHGQARDREMPIVHGARRVAARA